MSSRINHNKKYYNLTQPQKMIYIGESIYPNTSQNSVSVDLELSNDMNLEFLRLAIHSVIRENPGLHLRIKTIGGFPYQYLDENLVYEVGIEDFRINEGYLKEKSWLDSKINRVYDLINDNLFEFTIYYTYSGNKRLLVQTHHIISDGFTNNSLINQINTKYLCYLNNETDVYIQKYSYLNYVDTEEAYLSSPRYEKSREYWREKFKHVDNLPSIIDSSKGRKGNKSKRFQTNFNPEIEKKIVSYCHDNNLSYPTFFLGALLVVLRVLSDSKEILVGTSSYNRLGSKEKEAVGMFVNILPLLFNIKEKISFKDIVDSVDKELGGLMRHQRFPLSHINSDSELRSLDIARSIEVIYTYQNPLLPFDYEYHFSNYNSHPILFRPIKKGSLEKFHLEIDYQLDCFNEKEIRAISKTFTHIIESLDDDIEKSLDFSKYKETMEDGFYLSGNLPLFDKTLHGVFEDSVSKYSRRIAITDRKSSLNYWELNNRSNYLASLLIDRGAGKEDPVVLLLERSVDMMISILGILKSGCCYLPVGVDQPIDRIKKIISLSGAKIVITNIDLGKELNPLASIIDIKLLEFPKEELPNPKIDISPKSLAYIIYTSGSTGEPKGVMIEHRSVINRLYWMQDHYYIDEKDKLLQKTPYTFDVSVWELLWWFFNGSSLHFLDPEGEKEPEAIVKAVSKFSITHIHFVPSMLTLFLNYIENIGSIRSLEPLKRIICSGEALYPSQVNKVQEILGTNNGTTIHNLYGPTEASIDVTYYDCNGYEDGVIPIGRSIYNTEIFILDKKGRVLPLGKSGELCISGIGLARGYYQREDLTESCFFYHKRLKRRLYRTGDMALIMDDGNIKYLGRRDNQVKVRGNRVELEEIEIELNKYPGIYESAVIAPEDENGNAYIGAYFVSSSNIPHELLRNHLKSQLPNYMIPSFFMHLTELPLTKNGKLNRGELPEPERDQFRKSYYAPVNDREEEICEVWEDVLKREKISRNDNFFDLGGDSLKLIKVHFKLQEKYDLTLQDLFEYQTVEVLASNIKLRNSSEYEFNLEEYKKVVCANRAYRRLEEYIEFSETTALEKCSVENILITGGTGYLGAHIVYEYLTYPNVNLILLVRGECQEEAEIRFCDNYSYYFGDKETNKARARLRVVIGDLTQEGMGLKEFQELKSSVECVVHCAANVKHYGNRGELVEANLGGTKRVVEFCNSGSPKKLIYISTISVGYNFNGEIFSEKDLPSCSENGNVYIDSKSSSEKFIINSLPRERVYICRVGNLISNLEKGKFQRNRSSNAFYLLMRGYLNKGVAPNIHFPFLDLTEVDKAAKAITLLGHRAKPGIYHIFNNNRVSNREFCGVMGIDLIDIDEFHNRVKVNDPIFIYGYYLKNISLLKKYPLNSLTNKILDTYGFKWSRLNSNDFKRIWDSWTNYIK